MSILWFVGGFAVATGFWGVMAHKFPSLFAWIVSSGADAVNKVDDQIKSKLNQK